MPEPMKEGLSKSAIVRLAANIQSAWPAFDSSAFIKNATKGIGNLELKERVDHISQALVRYLPQSYPEASDIIAQCASTWDRGDENNPLSGFAAWPLFRFIELRGIEDCKRSMAVLRKITHLFSAEFAIRAFVETYPKQVFPELKRWTKDESEHVRRLVSEGIRPRLPWAKKLSGLIADPTPVFDLLELLRDDPAIYVRRSVGNNLNDIAKDHPDLVLDLCYRWAEHAPPERQWIIERATRTLVKEGHPRVWGLLGFTKIPSVRASSITVSPKRLRIGEECEFVVDLTSTAKKKQRLAIDYAVHYTKANGKTRAKVFKLKVLALAPGQTASLRKRHSFVQRSTRKHYPGTHTIELLVNGSSTAQINLQLGKAG